MKHPDLSPCHPTRADLDAWWERMRMEPVRPRPAEFSRLPLPNVLGYAKARRDGDWPGVRFDLQLVAQGLPTREWRNAEWKRRTDAHALIDRQEAAARAMGLL